ncbi:MAG: NAD-dependent deacetylase [Planctomycetaceae bacterium]
MTAEVEQQLDAAAEAIDQADAILIGAGAGMGVDSGLPDFRGDKGFWNAYPPFKGKRFAEISNPVWFKRDPEMAWGFFGHRLNLYRDTKPHDGFQILRRLMESRSEGGFVFTSNVDGHFQRSGFDEVQVIECHGALTHLQCTVPCSHRIWPSTELQIEVDMDAVRATSELPTCEGCGGLARPNVLMFGDMNWAEDRCSLQQQRYETWLESVRSKKLAVIEIGAGTGVPTVRYECERRLGTLIRINPRDIEVPADGISIPMGGLEALRRIEERM